MPFDSWSSTLGSRIIKLDRWIAALENAGVSRPEPHFVNRFTLEIKAEILRHLTAERDGLQRQLEQHRRHDDEERGVKY